jgi:hypothetical protein
MCIHSKLTVEEHWKAIEKEYTEKGAYAQTEILGVEMPGQGKCPGVLVQSTGEKGGVSSCGS